MIVHLSGFLVQGKGKIPVRYKFSFTYVFISFCDLAFHGGQPFMFYSPQSYAGRRSRDQEGIAVDGSVTFYCVTSHSKT